MPVTTTFEFRPEELKRGIRAIKPSQIVMLYVLPVLFTFVLAGGLAGFQHAGQDIVCGVIGLAMSLWLLTRYRKTVALVVAKLSGPMTVELDDENYTAKTANFSQTVNWSMFVRVKTTDEFWLLYSSKNNAVILPKRAFEPEQRTAVESLLQRRQPVATA